MISYLDFLSCLCEEDINIVYGCNNVICSKLNVSQDFVNICIYAVVLSVVISVGHCETSAVGSCQTSG